MPELPEVETIVRALSPVMSGKTLKQIRVTRRDILHGDPAPLESVLESRVVHGVVRSAKRIRIEFEGDITLVVHLGMSGRLTLNSIGDPVEPHTHFRACIVPSQRPGYELRFKDPRRFGGLWLLTGNDEYVGRRLGTVGPDPLELRAKAFRTIVQRKRPIKSLLLDQSMVGGIGNIYCDESLFEAGIHPLTPADQLNTDQADGLLRALKKVLRKAISHKGTTLIDYRTADGNEGGYRKHHNVYRRDGLPCKSCREPVQRIVLGGRGTFYCPQCQILPL